MEICTNLSTFWIYVCQKFVNEISNTLYTVSFYTVILQKPHLFCKKYVRSIKKNIPFKSHSPRNSPHPAENFRQIPQKPPQIKKGLPIQRVQTRKHPNTVKPYFARTYGISLEKCLFSYLDRHPQLRSRNQKNILLNEACTSKPFPDIYLNITFGGQRHSRLSKRIRDDFCPP